MSESDADAATTADRREVSDAVSKAEQADAAGNHAEAVDRLASAARRDDLEALTRLGKRLLVGDRAPLRPNDGARLLSDAVERGGAEAAAVVAVLYAVGASRGHGLEQALGNLALAAERGWHAAQRQLCLLAGESALGAADGHGLGADWRRVAGRIDLSAWQRVPAGTDLSADPLIRVVPGFLDDGVCDWLIERSRDRLAPARVYEALSKKTTVSETRTNTAATLNLLDTDFVCVLVQTRIAACLSMPFRQLEPISVLHYDEGEQITEHFDFVDPRIPGYEQEIASRGQRVVTFLVYLNDDYGGGETRFPELSISYRGRRGEGLFFVNSYPDGSADMRTLHAGRPPTSGAKWIVSQFVRDRATL